MIPPAIDPRQLAAEIDAAVSEFNRLTALAIRMNVAVKAEVDVQLMTTGSPERPVLRVQVVAP